MKPAKRQGAELPPNFRCILYCRQIKSNRISEDLLHGHFIENFIKSEKISLVTYKNM